MLEFLFNLFGHLFLEILGWRTVLCLFIGFLAAVFVLQMVGSSPLRWILASVLVVISAALGRIWDVATRE